MLPATTSRPGGPRARRRLTGLSAGRAIPPIGAGGSPQYEAMVGQDANESLPSIKRGMLQRIDDWQELLAAMDPAVADGTVRLEDRSPEPFAGHGMIFDDRVKIILYNSDMI